MYKTKMIPQSVYGAALQADIWSISQGHMDVSQAVYVPTVIKKSPNGDRAFDIYSALLEDNNVFLETPIDFSVATNIEASLLYLASTSEEGKDINLHISSPGGSVSAGLQILDTMWYIQHKHKKLVNTICTGIAMSMGAFLLAAGTGRRTAFPNASILIHQPLISGGGIGGQATDIDIHSEHMQETKRLLTCYLALHTGQDVATVYADCERDFYMTAEEAKEYGIVDQVFQFGRRKELAPLMDQYDAALAEHEAKRNQSKRTKRA